MSTKKKLAEMMRRKNELEAKVKAIKESKSKTGLAFLIESELEKAEVLLAAKSVVEKLQKMAEDLAKVNGDEIMPIMEPLKAAFGPEMAEEFQRTVSEHINQTTMAVSQAKDAVSAEVAKFEGIINGEHPGNDMSTMDASSQAPVGGDAAGSDFDMGDDDMAGDVGGETVSAETDFETDAPGADAPIGNDDPFNPDANSASGRAKKESAAPKRAPIKESTDARILKAFRAAIREGAKPAAAAQKIADKFAVDFADVVEIIRESSLGK